MYVHSRSEQLSEWINKKENYLFTASASFRVNRLTLNIQDGLDEYGLANDSIHQAYIIQCYILTYTEGIVMKLCQFVRIGF